MVWAAKSKIKAEDRKMYLTIAIGLIVAIGFCVGVVVNERRAGMPSAMSTHVTQKNDNLVINTVGAPQDLVSTIAASQAGCKDMIPSAINTVYIIRADSNFAKVNYGCSLDAYMYYVKKGDVWQSVSPTNKFIYMTPICSMVVEYKIPPTIDQMCYDQQLDAELQPVSDQPPALIQNPNT